MPISEKAAQQIAELSAKHAKAAIDRAVAPLIARIGQLESDLAALQAGIGKSVEEPR